MKNSTKTIILISSIVALCLLLFVLPMLLKHIPDNPEGTVGNTAGNLNNKGLFCEVNGKVYFSNVYDGGSLYSMNPDETGMSKLNSLQSTQINGDSNYIYYFGQNLGKQTGLGYVRTKNAIYRSTLNGKRTTTIKQVPVFNLQLVDNYLYYLYAPEKSRGCLYRIGRDKQDDERLTTFVVNPSCAEDGIIYYNGTVDNHYLFALDTKTDLATAIWPGNIWYPVKSGNYIYFLDVSSNYSLCRYDLSTGGVDVLTNERVELFNLNDVFIYYQTNAGDNSAFKRMYLDGTGEETIASGTYTNINITSNYVYFQPFENQVIMYKTPAYEAVNVTDFEAAKASALKNLK